MCVCYYNFKFFLFFNFSGLSSFMNYAPVSHGRAGLFSLHSWSEPQQDIKGTNGTLK